MVVSGELVAIPSIPSSHSFAFCMSWNQTLQEVERMREVWRYVFTLEWLKLKKPTQKGNEDNISSAGTKGKYILFQAVARGAMIVESRGQELLARILQRKCPYRKILVFCVKDHYKIWRKCVPWWESRHFILATVFTTNSICTLLSHLFSCSCMKTWCLLHPLLITSHQSRFTFCGKPWNSSKQQWGHRWTSRNHKH